MIASSSIVVADRPGRRPGAIMSGRRVVEWAIKANDFVSFLHSDILTDDEWNEPEPRSAHLADRQRG